MEWGAEHYEGMPEAHGATSEEPSERDGARQWEVTIGAGLLLFSASPSCILLTSLLPTARHLCFT